jgi:prepilin-type N-terminal cleavage/methylation domain-containing protein
MRRVGFSLIELVIVVVIIGVLAAMVVPRVVGASERAQAAAVRANLVQIEKAMLQYEAEYGAFPRGEWSDAVVLLQPYLRVTAGMTDGSRYKIVYAGPGSAEAASEGVSLTITSADWSRGLARTVDAAMDDGFGVSGRLRMPDEMTIKLLVEFASDKVPTKFETPVEGEDKVAGEAVAAPEGGEIKVVP